MVIRVRQIVRLIFLAGVVLAGGILVGAQTAVPTEVPVDAVAETLVLPEAEAPSEGGTLDARWIIFGGFMVVLLLGIGVGVVFQRGRTTVHPDDAETVQLRVPVGRAPRGDKPSRKDRS